MSAITDSLKKLVCALGSASNPSSVSGDNIAEVVDQITDTIKNKPVPVDNSDLRIHVTDGSEANTYVSDVTFSEIAEAIEENKNLVCDLDVTLESGTANLTVTQYSRNYNGSGDLVGITFLASSFTTVDSTPIAGLIAILIANDNSVAISLQLLELASSPNTYDGSPTQ